MGRERRKMELGKRNKLYTALGALLGVAVLAALFFLTPQGRKMVGRADNDTVAADTVKRRVRPQYEFGQPADVLAERSPMAAAMVRQTSDRPEQGDTLAEAAGKANDGAQAIETRVKAAREHYKQLLKVNEDYRKVPSQALREQGRKLKEQVLTEVSGLMPLARRYNYKKGIDEAQEMRRHALEMPF